MKKFILLSSLIIVLFSCKKEKNEEAPEPVKGYQLNKNSSAIRWEKIHFLSENRGYVAGTHGSQGYVIRTINGGESWDTSKLNFGDYLSKLYFKNSSTGYVLSHNYDWNEISVLHETTDAGKSWNERKFIDEEINDMVFSSDLNGIMVGRTDFDNVLIYKTQDGGFSWIKQHTGLKGNLYSVDQFNSTVCAGGLSYNSDSLKGIILLSKNNGLTWKSILFPYYFNIMNKVKLADENTIIVMTYHFPYHNLYVSTDEGKNWKIVNESAYYLNDFDYKDGYGMTAGNSNKSFNSFITTEPCFGLATDLECVSVPSRNVAYFGGKNGLLMKYKDR